MTEVAIYKSKNVASEQSGGSVIVSGEKLPRAVREGIVGLYIAFPGRSMEVAEQSILFSIYGEAVATYEAFIAAFVLARACIRPPDPRFRPSSAQVEELCNATRNVLRFAVLQHCLNGSHWYVTPKDLPDRWFGEHAAAAPFTPNSLVPDDVACRWIREHIERTEKVEAVRQVAEWQYRDYRSGYSHAPDCLRHGYSPAALKRLPDAALPEGFRAAYEAALSRLATLRQEEESEREAERAAREARRGTWLNEAPLELRARSA